MPLLLRLPAMMLTPVIEEPPTNDRNMWLSRSEIDLLRSLASAARLVKRQAEDDADSAEGCETARARFDTRSTTCKLIQQNILMSIKGYDPIECRPTILPIDSDKVQLIRISLHLAEVIDLCRERPGGNLSTGCTALSARVEHFTCYSQLDHADDEEEEEDTLVANGSPASPVGGNANRSKHVDQNEHISGSTVRPERRDSRPSMVVAAGPSEPGDSGHSETPSGSGSGSCSSTADGHFPVTCTPGLDNEPDDYEPEKYGAKPMPVIDPLPSHLPRITVISPREFESEKKTNNRRFRMSPTFGRLARATSAVGLPGLSRVRSHASLPTSFSEVNFSRPLPSPPRPSNPCRLSQPFSLQPQLVDIASDDILHNKRKTKPKLPPSPPTHANPNLRPLSMVSEREESVHSSEESYDTITVSLSLSTSSGQHSHTRGEVVIPAGQNTSDHSRSSPLNGQQTRTQSETPTRSTDYGQQTPTQSEDSVTRPLIHKKSFFRFERKAKKEDKDVDNTRTTTKKQKKVKKAKLSRWEKQRLKEERLQSFAGCEPKIAALRDAGFL